jgi:threonine dehydrogenase-like Zn-dependent dehydrogenase
MFGRNVNVRGGVAPVRTYLPDLLADVLAGAIDPSPIFTESIPLTEVAAGYAAMDARTQIKVLLRP